MKRDLVVSVIVITYNSEKYIIETLESIKRQTYPKIELIISDDCSTDKTINLIKEWLKLNQGRFINHIVVESKINTGITKNCNRGARAASGDFIKFIAGDDLLLNNCIDDLVSFCLENDLKLALSKAVPFYDEDCSPHEIETSIQENFMMNFYKKDQKDQYREFLTRFRIGYSLIGGIMNRELFLSLGGFNEKYMMMEDYPFYLKVLAAGHRLFLLDEYTVKYRVHTSDTMVDFKKTRRYRMWFESLRMFEVDELLPRLKKERMYLAVYDLYIRRLALKIYSENDNKFAEFLSKIIRYLSPLIINDKATAINCKMRNIFWKRKKAI